MMTKPDRRGDTPAAQGSTRVKVWTGLGTVMLAGAALSLAPSVLHAGLLGKAAKPASGAHRHSSSPSTVTRAAKVARVVNAGRAAKAAKAVSALKAAKVARVVRRGW